MTSREYRHTSQPRPGRSVLRCVVKGKGPRDSGFILNAGDARFKKNRAAAKKTTRLPDIFELKPLLVAAGVALATLMLWGFVTVVKPFGSPTAFVPAVPTVTGNTHLQRTSNMGCCCRRLFLCRVSSTKLNAESRF